VELGGLAGAFLGNFFSGSLLVETTVKDGPVELARILFGQKVGFTFAI
jgi:hypothetical protein